MTIKFYLTRPQAKKKSSIFFLINHKGLQYRYYTGLSVKPSEWKNKSKEPAFKSVLADFEVRAAETFYRLLKENKLDEKTVTEALKIEFSNKVDTNSFVGYMQDYIYNKKFKPATYKAYKYAVTTVEEYQEYKNKKYRLSEIDTKWFENYKYYMEHIKGYAINSMYVTFSFLKNVLKHAYQEKLIPNRVEIKNTREDIKQVYLTSIELEHFYKFRQYTRRRQEYVDAFLIMAYTCLRISDYNRLKIENIRDNKIFMPTKKTSKFVVIPLHKMVIEIIEKYNNRLPRAGNSQSFGPAIKAAAKEAGFTDPVISGKSHKGKYNTVIKERWEMITAHTARRSGATNMYLSGIPIARIMKLTAHKTETSFFKYICIGDDENAEELLQHDFFK
ncbi:tyrosine-type recombinase/integrase [Chondrinema litorale]|uniref:tyrosine-type recombinase/integrase n=1 Tax=Chondrinema litorale TaxID=2994555 RepID=UPI002543D1C1|nr:site-specific integrase [Chondrinema litorale]UZS00295.1 site-specific integrase [Chondrinema litorale]